MLLFRSEGHLDRWRAAQGLHRGAILTLEQTWGLAKAWHHDRLDIGWRRKTVDEAEAIFLSLGLTGPFWRLKDDSVRTEPDSGHSRE